MTRAKKLENFGQLEAMFPAELHDALARLAQDAEYIVVYEVLDPWSSRFGERSALKVGPGCSVETLDKALSIWLGDLPSHRKYPVAYWEVKAE